MRELNRCPDRCCFRLKKLNIHAEKLVACSHHGGSVFLTVHVSVNADEYFRDVAYFYFFKDVGVVVCNGVAIYE